MVSVAPVVDSLVARGIVFGLFARLLGEDPKPLVSGTDVVELRALLEFLEEGESLGALARLDEIGPLDEEGVLARRVRLFETGKVAPYELSHVPPGAASHMGVLADVAAFYKAYNTAVSSERPDHCVAELEFASLVTLAEADCHTRGDDEGIAVNSATIRRFLADHLGGWLGILAAKLDDVDPAGPYGPVVLAACHFVDAEMSRRGVIPIRRAGVVPDWDDWDVETPECGDASSFTGQDLQAPHT